MCYIALDFTVEVYFTDWKIVNLEESKLIQKVENLYHFEKDARKL